MYWSIEKFIGSRYLLVGRTASTTRLISAIAILAIALGVSVLLTIASIMNGFEEELRSRILGLSSHVQIDASGLTLEEAEILRLNIKRLASVESVAPYIEEDLILQSGSVTQLVRARGVDAKMEMQVTDLEQNLVSTQPLTNRSYRVFLGKEIASTLGVSLGSRVTAVAPRPLVTPVGLMPRMKNLVVTGVFEFGVPEHDSELVLLSLGDAQRLFRKGETIDGLRVRLHHASETKLFVSELSKLGEFRVTEWTETNSLFFRALQIEKLAMSFILAAAMLLASFNVIAILFVAVRKRRKDIAILRAIGMSRARIMQIFLFQGACVGVIGVISGLVLGAILSFNIDHVVFLLENFLGHQLFPPDVFYISRLPTAPALIDFVVTAVIGLLLAILVPLYPAWLASHLTALDGLRNE
jgi:lipoprotein-releasing system permease protein